MATILRQDRQTHVRWMIKRDLPEVLGIEADSYEDAWSYDEVVARLRNRNIIGIVAERTRDDAVVGHMLYELHKHHIEILRLGVDAAYRRQGIGRSLIERIAGKLSFDRRPYAEWWIDERDLSRQLFLRSVGFRAEDTMRDMFGTNDGYRFVLSCFERKDAHART